MNTEQIKSRLWSFVKKWWCSLLLLPFILYSLHQTYWVLNYNIFFSINYDFPFPISVINIFVDNFLLIVHEAGHTFASVLDWRTFTILNGSLFQLFIPFLILAYFWINNNKVGTQLSLYLVGFSLLDVAFYIADAERRQLPLIGGLPKEAHDWHNLLLRWNAMESGVTIAIVVTLVAVCFYIAALVAPQFIQQYNHTDLHLDL